MRIVIDMQGTQTESRFRGIGRYTMSFVQAVVRNRGEHEIILALSNLFPNTIEAIRTAFDGVLPQENIRVWHAPGPVREEDPGNETRREVAELFREAFLASLQPDVIHISSLFEGYVDDAVTSIGRLDKATPVSVTLFDLIPLLNPDHYLKPNPRYEVYYKRKIDDLKQAATLLAISEFSRQEGIAALSVSKAQIVNTSGAIESHFQPLALGADTANLLRAKFGITRPFVLYTGGSDERKNLPRLVNAYAVLPTSLHESHQLVFAGKMPESDIARFQLEARRAGLQSDELIFTGYVSDEELVQIYNLCQLCVFPSWHEGFGLPALEAMACGAPVIGANTSSLPEVIGLDEALFDPLDVASITGKMQQALTDEAFRTRLIEHGLQQAKKFSWDETASRAIAAWEILHHDTSTAAENPNPNWHHIHERLAQWYIKLIQAIANTSSASVLQDDELRRIAACIERNERQTDDFLRPSRLPENIAWRIEGPFDSSYSLALVNRQIARALAALGHQVALHSTEGPGDFPPNPAFLKDNPDLDEMHRRARDTPHIAADVVSRNLYPPRVEDMSARLNLLHVYAWEESGFPLEWVENFNASLQGIAVATKHVRKIMIDHGVTVPITVCGEGADHWKAIQPAANFRIDARAFRFLHVSSCFPRKGADVMLRAYGRAFRDTDDVSLVIKTFPNPHNDIHRWLDEARADDPHYPHVLILETDYTDAQLKALYQQCHALVAPSRAEGFGLPMAEAMLSDLAVITTGWSGQTDFCTPDTAWLIDYTFERAQTHFALSASVWAEPDETHLAALMTEVWCAPQAARQARIAAGQRLLDEHFTWARTAERMTQAARSYAQGTHIPEPRIGWVTTWNTRCGIATYSENLIHNMPGAIIVLAAETELRTAADSPDVRRCWTAGEQDTLDALARVIEKEGLDTLVIQFNYGFFNLETFAGFLERQIDAGRTVVVTLHSTTDPVHVPYKTLKSIRKALQSCHRVLVHTPNDMNRLKTLGLDAQVTLFPHGIMDYTPPAKARTVDDRAFIVASYGFFLPHKGLLELIDAIALLKARGHQVELRMVNAEYPAPQSRALIEQARESIHRHALGDTVSICTEFLEDQDSLARLAQADLIVFPYQDTGESASGAVRYGLAAGRPVAVTPLAIFDDVRQATHILPGQTPEALATGIADLIKALATDRAGMRDKDTAAEHWRAEHRYSRIAPRLHRMLEALNHYRRLSSC